MSRQQRKAKKRRIKARSEREVSVSELRARKAEKIHAARRAAADFARSLVER